eukprot:TRINITY_DN6720_c0_g2_i2.p1 TRINITY_DN6720_c0_g2~~TRINITY_DN6720_c0_g2_i2.p1  ORF type:complete len:256 (-),score=8.83 TRINITY_DN6720_c0_g2_i2:169-936(-)
MGSKQDIQDWNLGLSQLLPRIYNVCSTYTNFKLSLVSQSLKAGFEDMLPVYQFKLKQNADDKEIQAMLWASNFKKDDRKKNCKEIADELRGTTSSGDVSDEPSINQTSTNEIEVIIDLNQKSVSLTKPLELNKQIQITNGSINGEDSLMCINKFNIQFKKINFCNEIRFESLEQPKICFQNCNFESVVLHPLSKGTVVSIQQSRVSGKLLIMTTLEASIHIDNCQVQLPQGQMSMFNGTFHLENCYVKNLLLRMD